MKLFIGLLHILQMDAGLHLSKFHSEDSYIEKKSSSVSYRSWSLFSKWHWETELEKNMTNMGGRHGGHGREKFSKIGIVSDVFINDTLRDQMFLVNIENEFFEPVKIRVFPKGLFWYHSFLFALKTYTRHYLNVRWDSTMMMLMFYFFTKH